LHSNVLTEIHLYSIEQLVYVLIILQHILTTLSSAVLRSTHKRSFRRSFIQYVLRVRDSVTVVYNIVLHYSCY